jgi:SAM-dependent methyltransferase
MTQTQTDWDEAYRRRETPWEKGIPHPALVDFLAENAPLDGKICVPGCGSGHDVRALGAPSNYVLGIDLATRAIAKANSRPRIANEEYLLADLFDLPSKFDRQFDWIFEHTCFCAIDPAMRQDYVETVVRLLKPQGKLFAIFFLNPDHDASGPPYGVSREELEKFFGPHFVLEREWIPQRTHPGREGRELMRVLARSERRASTRQRSD